MAGKKYTVEKYMETRWCVKRTADGVIMERFDIKSAAKKWIKDHK